MDEEGNIIQVREELMVSPSGGNPIHRTGYFLKPCMSCSTKEPSLLNFTTNHAISKLPPLVSYNGWRRPQEEWKKWVQKMKLKYEYLWIKAGIDQAIKASTYEINRNNELILSLAQRWCSKTKTFIFPWGEATITLEDMKVCWGYSVMGCPVSSPLVTSEQKNIEAKLVAARRMFNSTKARKVVQSHG
ncbi:Aminotransferase-like, plant mobile domain [Sesbania bispinosa]|nr:Aminotransferase-like, plant mobile domain [Sesbania bispinosa]